MAVILVFNVLNDYVAQVIANRRAAESHLDSEQPDLIHDETIAQLIDKGRTHES